MHPHRSVSADSRRPAPESAPAAAKGWMDSVKGCIGDLCNRKSKPNPNPSSAFHTSVVGPVHVSTMLPPRHIMTPPLAKQQEKEERDAQKELIEAQKKLKEEQKELNEDQRKLLERKRVFDGNQKELEDEIDEMSRLYESDKAKLTGFSLPSCGKCSRPHMPSSCPLFTDQQKTMKIQQESYEKRQAELDKQQRSLNERQRLFNERRDSMMIWLPNPWSRDLYADEDDHAHVDGGAKTKRRHSKTKRSKSKSKSKKGKKSHRRHH